MKQQPRLKLNNDSTACLQQEWNQKDNPIACPQAVIQGDTYRFTILTERLIRMEYHPQGHFTEEPSQVVLNREFPLCRFEVMEKEDSLCIRTSHLCLNYDKKEFSMQGLTVSVGGALTPYHSTYSYGMKFTTLGGTARTLDEADGEVELEPGLMSYQGFSVIDDSHSLLMTTDGWVKQRPKGGIDLYFFGYGRDYKQCLKAFYHLCGRTPVIPRYALGNWWSRFHRYDEEEYRQLILEFEHRGIPFSVAVIDMDWHITNPDPKYGSGWTGYTWNKELFPDPAGFLSWLHEQGMHVTLNEHPADGIRAFEDNYKEMAAALGINAQKEELIAFDMTDPKFVSAYFTYIHHPNEKIGVDFWWVDWQQGAITKVPGLDPLWMLNHYHYKNSIRDGKQGLIFSRYAGIGSHRYPIGFSGDSIVSWKSLQFQPYFTATASNVGYGWWSHDIGGHMHGKKDEELQLRWLQFGVFSPIMRLHCAGNPFFDKRPWMYQSDIGAAMVEFLRLRHRMIPYLYTMDEQANRIGRPLILPLYYEEPDVSQSYQYSNEYYFGTELLVCPITVKCMKEMNLAAVKAYLPKGMWYDMFSHMRYSGERSLTCYRDFTSIPVFVKAGSILPLDQGEPRNQTSNPSHLLIEVFTGASGSFELYEDNAGYIENSSEDHLDLLERAVTKFTYNEPERTFTIEVTENETVIPKDRTYEICFIGSTMPCTIQTDEKVTVRYEKAKDKKQWIFTILNHAMIAYDLKEQIFHRLTDEAKDDAEMIAELMTMNISDELLGALIEVLTTQ